MLSLGEVLGVTGNRADVRVWLATGGVIDVELPAVNANLLTVGASVVVAFTGEGEDSGIVLGAIDGSAAAAALVHSHGGGDITSAVASATDADTVDGEHASAFADASHSHGGGDITSAVASATDADTVDGEHASAFADASHSHGGGDITSAVASATDADTVDGQHAAAFAASGHGHVTADLADDAVSNAKLADMAVRTVKAQGATAGDPQDMTHSAFSSLLSGYLVSWIDFDDAVTDLVNPLLTALVQLAGRAGGQNVRGGTAASENLLLESTSHATKGQVQLQPNGGVTTLPQGGSAAAPVLAFAGDTHTGLYRLANDKIALVANGQVVAVFDGSTGAGRLGVGTSSPAKRAHVAGTLLIDGDEGGVANTIGLTDVTDMSANSTGIGTVKMKGATSRDSAGFVKMYIGTTAYYFPVWAAVTG